MKVAPFLLLAVTFILGLAFPNFDRAITESTIFVTTFSDELINNGNCSLREAVRAANTDLPVDNCPAGDGADTIVLSAGVYFLAISGRNEDQSATGDLDILGNLTLSGVGKNLSVIDGVGLDRVFEIKEPAVVSISEVTIQGGNPGTSFGGPQVYGGGISIFGNATLTLHQVTLQNNTAYQGGGLENNGGTVNLSEVRIRQNSATFMGGVHSTGALHMIDCIVDGNSSTNYSGGVHSEFSLILENSTVSGNTAQTNGGGLYIHGGTAEIVNSTVSGNQISGVQGSGVWIYYQAQITITNSTISSNSRGGGVYNYHEGPGGDPQNPNIHFFNTLFSGNTPTNCARSLNTPMFQSLGHNLDSGNSCELNAVSDLVNTPAGLSPLQDNGGPTLTHALLAGSAAVNAADNIGCPATDQRGVPRPQGGICDIGSYERMPTGEANLSLAKVDAVDPILVGGNIVYDLTVDNLGPDSAVNTILTDNLPAGVSFVSATPSQGTCGHTSGVVTCSLGSIANAGGATVQIVVTADTTGVKTNNASVISSTADPNPANNSASASTMVNPYIFQADLSLTKVDIVDPVTVADTITYTLTVGNTGPDSAVNTVLTDNLPDGVSFVSTTPSQGTCNHASGVVTCDLESIANTGSVTIQIVATANTAGVKTNNASVTSSISDPNPANNSASVSTNVVLGLNLPLICR